MSPRHFPKIRGGQQAPQWLIDHTEQNRFVLGPPPELLEEWALAGLELPDLPAMRRFRLERLRAELRRNDLDGILLHDPLNVRYATDTTNMPIWTMHNEVRYVFVATDGPVVLFEFSNGEFLSGFSDVIDEIRPAISLHPFYAGPENVEARKTAFAAEIATLIDDHQRTGDRRLAIDPVGLDAVRALEAQGLDLVEGMQVMENARTVKGPDEIRAMRCAVHACERNIEDMRAMFEPGVTEVELWAQLQHSNWLRFGEWVETRIMASGARTNPWYHEASIKPIAAGEFLGFDTDLVGAYGMCVDMSRTWLCGDGAPSPAQQDVYGRARHTVESNIGLFVAGTTIREITERITYPDPEVFNGYTVMAHAVGLCDEFPSVFTRDLWDTIGHDMTLEPGNMFCVESFVGRRDGGEGVKLEQQILVTDAAPEVLTTSSMDW